MSEEFGLLSTYGGRTNFPTLFDDLVIFSGVQTVGVILRSPHRFIAFDKRTGQSVWLTSTRLRPEDTTTALLFWAFSMVRPVWSSAAVMDQFTASNLGPDRSFGAMMLRSEALIRLRSSSGIASMRAQ